MKYVPTFLLNCYANVVLVRTFVSPQSPHSFVDEWILRSVISSAMVVITVFVPSNTQAGQETKIKEKA